MSDLDDRKRELLERDANRTRERLVETLQALDVRRHDITDVKKQVREHAAPIFGAAAALVVGIGTVLGVSIYRLATRKQRLREERMRALSRLWRHPERLARKDPPKGSLAYEVGKRVLASALTFAALQLTKRSLSRLAQPRAADPPTTRVVVRSIPA